jgi:Zn-dependent protease
VKLLKLIQSILPPIFWGLVIFGFEEPSLAVITLLCALIHELGHFIFTPCEIKIRGVVSGFRIKPQGMLSYPSKLISYTGGPMANLVIALLCFSLYPLLGEYIRLFAILNTVTALTNLMPIEGYDGYGIIVTLLEMKDAGAICFDILRWVNRSVVMLTCIFSLYLIDRIDGGYWIFALFFSFTLKLVNSDISRRF